MPRDSESRFQSSFCKHRFSVTNRILNDKYLWTTLRCPQCFRWESSRWCAEILNSEPYGWLLGLSMSRISGPVISTRDQLWPWPHYAALTLLPACISAQKRLRVLLSIINHSNHSLRKVFCILQGPLKFKNSLTKRRQLLWWHLYTAVHCQALPNRHSVPATVLCS